MLSPDRVRGLLQRILYDGAHLLMLKFLRDLLLWYGIAPMQLAPNIYRAAIGMFLWEDQGFEPLTLEEFTTTYKLMTLRNSEGMYYLSPYRNDTALITGLSTSSDPWKTNFFWVEGLWDTLCDHNGVARVCTWFRDPSRFFVLSCSFTLYSYSRSNSSLLFCSFSRAIIFSRPYCRSTLVD